MMILDTTAWIYISDALGAICIFAVMPTLVVLICLMTARRKFEKRAELVKTAMEKDPSFNMEDLMVQLSPAKKTYAQKSVSLILVSSILLFLGLAAAVLAFVFKSNGVLDGFQLFGLIACVIFSVGLAFLVTFFYTRGLARKGMLE